MAIDKSLIVLAPDSGGSAPRKEQIISGTGTTEAHNTTALTPGAWATLVVSKTSAWVAFRSAAGLSTVVSSANIELEKGSVIHWLVDANSIHVYAEAADASSAYKVSVWQSSPSP